MEPLPHVDPLVDETRGARFFTKLDLASAYMQFRIREADQFKTLFRVPCGQYMFRVGTFGRRQSFCATCILSSATPL